MMGTVLAGSAIPAQAGPAPLPLELTQKVTTDGVFRQLQAFQRIAQTNNGNRAAGTSGYERSLEYVVNKLTQAGFRVSTPEFTYRKSTVERTKISQGKTNYDGRAFDYSASTPVDGITAPLRVASRVGCQASDYPATTRGAIVLIQRGQCTFAQKQQLATQPGASAALIYNSAPGSFNGNLGEDASGIPIAALSGDTGQALLKRQGSRITVDIQVRIEQTKEKNVIAQTRSGHTDNVVMAGTHLDGVPAGSGINDNASGSAALLETALQLGSNPQIENSVRFAWWGAEELGLIGSRACVEKMPFEQQLDIAMYLNFDMIGSPNAGYFVNGYNTSPSSTEPVGSREMANAFASYIQNEKGIVPDKQPLGGGTDHVYFARAGIPSAGLFTGIAPLTEEQAARWNGVAGQPADPNYHSAGDTLNNINRRAIDVNSDAMAWVIASYALDTSSVNGVPPREQRAAQRAAAPELLRSPGAGIAEELPVFDEVRGAVLR
ncbi:M20/M25/M40 family metallo-hydrolase [Acaricomes phytoseiuli]|nr:M20/M25/M40 family metallo-hydrolase [Acaricomes phytoseiuli]MCW1249665.1 M20/M25/M40 family metallo-hydrolase [Acaricomes phytoseiuli]